MDFTSSLSDERHRATERRADLKAEISRITELQRKPVDDDKLLIFDNKLKLLRDVESPDDPADAHNELEGFSDDLNRLKDRLITARDMREKEIYEERWAKCNVELLALNNEHELVRLKINQIRALEKTEMNLIAARTGSSVPEFRQDKEAAETGNTTPGKSKIIVLKCPTRTLHQDTTRRSQTSRYFQKVKEEDEAIKAVGSLREKNSNLIAQVSIDQVPIAGTSRTTLKRCPMVVTDRRGRWVELACYICRGNSSNSGDGGMFTRSQLRSHLMSHFDGQRTCSYRKLFNYTCSVEDEVDTLISICTRRTLPLRMVRDLSTGKKDLEQVPCNNRPCEEGSSKYHPPASVVASVKRKAREMDEDEDESISETSLPVRRGRKKRYQE